MEQVLLQPQTAELSKNDFIKVPTTLKNKVLMSPGQWNGVHYAGEEIKRAFDNTDWKNKDITSIILDHADKPLSVHDWVGWVKNPRMVGENLIGDLELYDEGVLIKVMTAKMKCGISPRVKGMEHEDEFRNFTFENFSIVTNPAVKKAFLNLAQITGMEAERKKRGLSPSQFYAAPRIPPSKSALPIFDAAHVRNALARFNQTKFLSPEEKKKAWNKVLRAARKFGIKTSKEMSYLYKLKGGKMTEKDLQDEASIEETEEVKEDKSEEAPAEEPKEEPKEEVKEMRKLQKKKKFPLPEEELKDEELLEVVTSPAWVGFVSKMREKDSKVSFKAIALAFQKKGRKMEELEEMNEEDLLTLSDNINYVLRSRNKVMESEEDLTPAEKKLFGEIKELKEKLDEPEAKSVELSSKPRTFGAVFDEDESHHSPGVLGMADFIKNKLR